jgi:hypothetical protein
MPYEVLFLRGPPVVASHKPVYAWLLVVHRWPACLPAWHSACCTCAAHVVCSLPWPFSQAPASATVENIRPIPCCPSPGTCTSSSLPHGDHALSCVVVAKVPVAPAVLIAELHGRQHSHASHVSISKTKQRTAWMQHKSLPRRPCTQVLQKKNRVH